MALTINPSTFQITSSGYIFDGKIISTNDTNVGTTLTAAQFIGGIIVRTGTSANFTDTTPTAIQICTLIGDIVTPSLRYPSVSVGVSFRLRIINTTAYTQTIAAGTGITLSGSMTIAAYSYVDFHGKITSITLLKDPPDPYYVTISAAAITLTNIGGSQSSTVKEYVAIMGQTGTAAPDVFVQTNTIGNIVWTRSSTGLFIGTLVGAFPVRQTGVWFNLGIEAASDKTSTSGWLSDDTVYFRVNNAGVASDNFDYSTIKINTYQ